MKKIVRDAAEFLQKIIEDERYLLSGYERSSEALTFETIRAIDFAFCREVIPEMQSVSDSELKHESVRKNAINAALRRVFPTELKSEMPRLFASNKKTADQTDEFLFRTGCLSLAEKQLNLLRSGALKAEFDTRKIGGSTLLVLTVSDKTAYREQIGLQGLNRVSSMAIAEDREKEEALERRHLEILPTLLDSLRSKGDPEKQSFMGVDEYFREWAAIYLRRISVRDMLDDNDEFGGRPYSKYVAVLEALSAMSQQRLCYAGLMNVDDPEIGIRNLLTGGAYLEDLVEAVANFLDIKPEDSLEILDHLTLSPKNMRHHLERGTPALAPIVRTSRNFVVLPMYGLELNPFSFLWTELRTRYEREWFEAANRRESRWVSQLRQLFPAPRWKCLDGVNIKRDGKIITDIDFVAYDSECKGVMLFQLKWQQPTMDDDKLRRNNASSLVRDSNKWIMGVLGWVKAVGVNGVKERLCISNLDEHSIYLVVLGRYHAHFTGAEDHDEQATWCDWGNFLHQRIDDSNASAQEFIEHLRNEVEQATKAIEPESFFFPIGDVIVLVNPRKIK